MTSLLNALGLRNMKQRIVAPIDEYWDRRLGVRTFGYNPATGAFGDPEWSAWFVPLPWRDIFAVLAAAGLGPDDVFTDLGSGTGRAVFAAAYKGARRAEGVERVPWLAAAAEENRRRGRLAAKAIRLIEADARAVSLAETTLLYIYHSFGTGVLREVLERAKRDRDAAGSGRLRICYVNPVYAEILDGTDWLRPLASLPAPRQIVKGVGHYATRIWESV